MEPSTITFKLDELRPSTLDELYETLFDNDPLDDRLAALDAQHVKITGRSLVDDYELEEENEEPHEPDELD